MWRSLVAWVRRRRPGVGPGDRVFGYAGAILPVLWTFVVLSAVELVAVHLVIPWPGGPYMTSDLGVRRNACDAGSAGPAYASASVNRRATPVSGATTILPIRSGATSSAGLRKNDRGSSRPSWITAASCQRWWSYGIREVNSR